MMQMEGVVFGHSFVKRSKKFIDDSHSDTLSLYQYKTIALHGYSGLTIQRAYTKLSNLNLRSVDVFILDIGSNDIRLTCDIVGLCFKLINLATHISHQYNCEIIIIQQFYRNRKKNMKKSSIV